MAGSSILEVLVFVTEGGIGIITVVWKRFK